MEDCVEEDEQQQQQQQQQEISEELQANRFTIAKEFLDWMHANQAKCAELKPVRVQLRGGYDSDDERNYDIDVISEEFPPQGIAICLQRHARDMEYFFFVTRRRYTRVGKSNRKVKTEQPKKKKQQAKKKKKEPKKSKKKQTKQGGKTTSHT
eukprot:scaffold471_cov318-Ochromonas_danica.AAC.16